MGPPGVPDSFDHRPPRLPRFVPQTTRFFANSTLGPVSGSQPIGQNLTSKNPPPCFENRFPPKIFAKFKTWPYSCGHTCHHTRQKGIANCFTLNNLHQKRKCSSCNCGWCR